METNKNEAITSRDIDFAKWYTDVCRKAELMDYSSVKGFIIYRPYGYAIWEQIQNYLNGRFKAIGVQNVYMPLVIPESLFNKEKEHVEGFAPETLIATIGGKSKIDDPLIIRPTSEVLFCEHYARIISSHRDLPKLYNQWCSVVRWEKTTRPFLRGSEFLWQEGHTIFATEQEARQNALDVLDIYDDLGSELLAIPFVKGLKTDKERFAGARETYSIEALMHDGKALQSGTTHYFGTGFAEVFGITYQGKDNVLRNPHQASWGVSTRLIGSIIMVHGDDNGLVLPPFVAPTQVIIIPIQQSKEGILTEAESIKARLEKAGFRVSLDDSDRTPGWKYAEYEMKGVPLRLEIGPRDLEKGQVVIARRVNGKKVFVANENIENEVNHLLNETHDEMYRKAKEFLKTHIIEVKTLEELKKVVDEGGYAKMMWCGERGCEDKIKEMTAATARCMPHGDHNHFDNKCAVCGKKADKIVYFAKAY
ncbi:MAG: proline--tRNA ligase [Bacilli bacterium]|jgi:prolyl-tRNA synthetase|nr:proline--tRNA ligase [Bacilli bacterium]